MFYFYYFTWNVKRGDEHVYRNCTKWITSVVPHNAKCPNENTGTVSLPSRIFSFPKWHNLSCSMLSCITVSTGCSKYVRVECKPNSVRGERRRGVIVDRNFVSIQWRYISHESQFEPTIGCYSSTNKKNDVTLEQHCHFVKPRIKFSSNTSIMIKPWWNKMRYFVRNYHLLLVG